MWSLVCEPVRILHLCPGVFGGHVLGGGDRYVSELIASLGQRPDVAQQLWVCSPARRLFQAHSATDVRTGRWRNLLRAARGCDVIHIYQLSSAAFEVGVGLSRMFSKPVILTDLGGGWSTPSRLLGRKRLAAVAGLAPLTDWSAGDVGWRAGDRPIARMFGGGDHVLRTPQSGSERPNPVDFLFVGRLVPHKGIHELIEALPAERRLRIVGNAALPSYLARLQASARDKRVEFVMRPHDGDLVAIYRSASWTVLPSVWEAFGQRFRRPELLGLVLLESLACGTPCMGSRVAGLTEVLERAGMPSFMPSDAQQLTRTLASAPLRGTPEYAVIQERARYAAEEFGWASTATRAMDLYRSVVA